MRAAEWCLLILDQVGVETSVILKERPMTPRPLLVLIGGVGVVRAAIRAAVNHGGVIQSARGVEGAIRVNFGPRLAMYVARWGTSRKIAQQ